MIAARSGSVIGPSCENGGRISVRITTPGTPEEEISKRREGGGKVIVA